MWHLVRTVEDILQPLIPKQRLRFLASVDRWYASGLCGQLRSTLTSGLMLKHFPCQRVQAASKQSIL